MKSSKLLNGCFRPMAGLLLQVAALGLLADSAPALAAPPPPPLPPVLAVPTLFPDLNEGQYCMGDIAGGKTNCTANDVAITAVDPLPLKDANGNVILDENGEPVMPTCELGEQFTFRANLTIQTTANDRYDTTFYLPLGDFSPKEVQGKMCGLLLPVAPPTLAPNVDPYKAYVKLDGDVCGDITKSAGSSSYTILDQEVTMFCRQSADPNRALFEYCAAWDNKTGDNCKGTSDGSLIGFAGAKPGTPSKCNCDAFPINVFIAPDAPPIDKTVDEPTSLPEPGGVFSYHIDFTNDSDGTLVITSLKDVIDVGGDGSYDQTIDLWNDPLQTLPLPADAADGIYLISRSASCMPTGNSTTIELASGGPFSCDFTLHIKDTDLDLPDEPTNIESVVYRDFVQAKFEDTNEDPVGPLDPDLCPTGYKGEGLNCSQVREVEITDEPPEISKRFDLKAVAFVRVTNDGDEPLTITSMKFKGIDVTDGANDGTLVVPRTFTLFDQSAFFNTHEAGLGSFDFCTTGGSIAVGGHYDCAFTLEFPPGLVTEGPINFSVGNPDYLEVTVEDNDGSSATYNVSITITTIE